MTPAAENVMKIATRAAVAPDGVLSGATELAFGGINDQIYRDAFSRWPVDYRKQFFAAQLKRAIPGATLETLEVTPADVRDMSVPLAVKLTFRATEFLAGESGGVPVAAAGIRFRLRRGLIYDGIVRP